MVAERRRRGATLIDTLVALAVFSGLLLVVVLISRAGRDAWQKTDVHAETFRAAVTATDHVRRLLVQGRLASLASDSVTFHPVLSKNGLPEMGESGALVFSATSCTVSRNAQGGLELREGPTGPARVLAHLGPQGSIHFERPRPNLVRVTVRAVIHDPHGRKVRESSHEIVSEVYLPNEP